MFETKGWDLEAIYALDLGELGSLRFKATATYLDRRDFIVNPSAANEAAGGSQAGGARHPPAVRYVRDGIRHGGFNLSADVRFVGKSVANVLATSESFGAIEADECYYIDMQGRYEFGNGVEAFVGVHNLTNEEPPRNPSVFSGTGRLNTPSQIGAAIYDVYGRSFYLGTTVRF